MSLLKLTDVAKINMGQSPSSETYNSEKNGLPFYQGNVDFGEKYPTARIWCDKPTKIAEPGDILISVRAPIGALNYANEECCIGRGLAAITPNSNMTSSEFIYWLLRAKHSELNRMGTGSTFKAINRKTLENIALPKYNKSEQYHIAEILSKIDGQLARKKAQMNKLDDLIKARFVELFGTINDNKYSYDIKTLQDVCEQIKDGTHQTPEYTEDEVNGFKFLSSKDVTSGKIDWNHPKYIPESLHNELYARIAPQKGDLLLAKNGTTGIAAIVDRDEIFDIYVSLALLRPIEMDSVYLWGAVNSAETKHQFDGSLKGIGVPNLHLGEIKKTKILVPPIDKQKDFTNFVKQVDKSKFAIQKSLEQTQLLFDSLMQKYFG